MQKWEYMVYWIGHDEESETTEANANEYGRDGWELVSVEPVPGTLMSRQHYKRPLPTKRKPPAKKGRKG